MGFMLELGAGLGELLGLGVEAGAGAGAIGGLAEAGAGAGALGGLVEAGAGGGSFLGGLEGLGAATTTVPGAASSPWANLGEFLMPSANASPIAGPGVSSSAMSGASDVGSLLSSGAAPGPGAASFAPAPGISTGGIAPDATSAAAFGEAGPGFPSAAAPGGSQNVFSNATGFEATNAATGQVTGGTFPPLSTPGAAPATGLPGADVAALPQTGAPVAAPGAAPATGGLPGSAGAGPTTAGAPSAAAPSNVLGIPGMSNAQVGGLGIATAGLGYNVMKGQTDSASTQKLADAAAQQSALGAQLSSYLKKGTLPPGLQTSLNEATAAAKANAISNAAAQGLPTDPKQNTALATTLAAIDSRATAAIAQIGQQLLTAGATESGMSNQLYQVLAQIDQTQTQNIGKAIANMAAALSTGGQRPVIQIGT